MKLQVVLALDAGTTSVRTLAVSPSAEILTTSQQEFNQIYPKPGLIEHDPEEIWLAAANTLKEVSQRVAEMGHDVGASACGRSEPCWDDGIAGSDAAQGKPCSV